MDFNLSAVKEKLGAVRNLVMNYSEIESKVRDATNNDAWGASGTVCGRRDRGQEGRAWAGPLIGETHVGAGRPRVD